MRVLRSVLALAALVGCQSVPRPVPTMPPPVWEASGEAYIERVVYLDPNLGALGDAANFHAMMAWAIGTRGQVHWKVEPWPPPPTALDWKGPGCSSSVILTSAKSNELAVKHLEAIDPPPTGQWPLAYTQFGCKGATVTYIVDRIPPGTPYALVATHELGHALGIHHTPKGSGIMTASTDDSTGCLTSTDYQALCSLHGCAAWSYRPDCR